MYNLIISFKLEFNGLISFLIKIYFNHYRDGGYLCYSHEKIKKLQGVGGL